MHARLLVLGLFSAAAFASAQQPIQIRVDLTDAPRQLIHVTETLPAHPGENSFSYPEWTPGQERPAGPIDNLAGLVFHAGTLTGPVLRWRRDLVDMFAFHVEAPPGTGAVAVAFDLLAVPSRANSTATKHFSTHVAMLEPGEVVLYPTGARAHDVPVTATVHLPSGWKSATALRVTGSDAPTLNGPDTTFQTVSLEKFVDSPVVAGDHCRQYPLAPEIHPVHTLNVCTDKDADLNLAPALLANMSGLVRQATLVFRSHHYAHYDFLVAASSHLDGDSEEHTESADYVVKSLDVSNPETANFLGNLLPHEYVHAWCGKYRRPVGDATPDLNTPMKNDLLWVYEGLTEYYGIVLAPRAGFRTPQQALSAIDREAWYVDQPGRTWRQLQDTADASAILRGVDPAWANWRLTQDYYYEGTLLWLEADMKIRELSHGARSLDDFSAAFFGARPDGTTGDTGPGVLPHTFADVVAALNATAAYDWQGFWLERLNALTPRPPLAGLEAAGYTYTDGKVMNQDEAAVLSAAHVTEMLHSVGLMAGPDGTLIDVWVNSPAFAAGLGPGDKLATVNGQPYSADALVKAVREAEGNLKPITVTAVRDEETRAYPIKYHGGEKYAVLVRNSRPEMLLGSIFKPRSISPAQPAD